MKHITIYRSKERDIKMITYDDGRILISDRNTIDHKLGSMLTILDLTPEGIKVFMDLLTRDAEQRDETDAACAWDNVGDPTFDGCNGCGQNCNYVAEKG